MVSKGLILQEDKVIQGNTGMNEHFSAGIMNFSSY